jgi:acrylyl-CoA reductase (NADPH)
MGADEDGPREMSTFHAFRVFDDQGAVEGRVVEATLGELSGGEVVIAASYSSVNYKDALAATGAGKIIRRFPLIPGIDVAGTVESSADPRVHAGDEVLVTGYDLGVGHDGGYAQYVRVPADWVVPIPSGLSAFEAMALGTAGFTAAMSIAELERSGLTPASGPVIVTGATGGVGSMAVQCLAALGYTVTALTGKDAEHEYLRSIGASQVLPRSAVQPSARPLEKATWAGAVDPVGGDTLAWLLRSMAYRGAVALSGLTGGTGVQTTVMPFILRGVRLIGVDSVLCPMDERLDVWRRLASDMKPAAISASVREIGLADLPDAFGTLKNGAARGRFVVNLKR